MEVLNAIGRRKTSVARVYLQSGKGAIVVNGLDFKTYFKTEPLQISVESPLNLLSEAGKYDIRVNVQGGGVTGQAEAIRLGIARALVLVNSEFKSPLRKEGLMTRDSRMVERKKYGKRKARKRFQFSKR
ncbi:30S ribosomal protein S9 [uncultured Cytophaga sp.]|uniref:30S ribosomal protein S9 n=1 Tax=uncultured Cytophaga sp. TaxID=160238 RepID=UPI002632ED48|nr:30S ribosomal protein S9 [uncultured Cytophaga sp.]